MARNAHTVTFDDGIWERLEKESVRTKMPVTRLIEAALCDHFRWKVPE